MDKAVIIIICLSLGYISYLIFEKYYHLKLRKNFKHIIHVNGTRGKSTVTRMIGHVLNENGFNVLIKTTGTLPTVILPDGTEKVLRRLGSANIKEQLKVLRIAKRAKADVIVVECMAINPKYQFVSHHKMLNANITVITNARKDHQEILGKTEFEIVKAFTSTISYNGVLFVNEEISGYYEKIAKERNTELLSFSSYQKMQDIDLYGENVGAALRVAEYFKIAETKALRDLKGYKKDVGSLKVYEFANHKFINGFSINDTQSLQRTLQELKINSEATFLINNRYDRAYRAKEHLEFLKEIKPQTVIVAGGYYRYFKRNLKDIDILKYKNPEQLKSFKLVFGFGNFKKTGLELINHYEFVGKNR